MWRDAWLVAGKDLRIEARSRVLAARVLPLAVVILVLFAFALDQAVLPSAATAVEGDAAEAASRETVVAGLFWVAVLFAAVLAVQRSSGIETEDGALDALRLSGVDPAGVFLGKAMAMAAQLLVLQAVLGVGVTLMFRVSLRSPLLLTSVVVLVTIGLAAVGTTYGIVAASLRGRETLLPLLVLPVCTPLLLSASQATGLALAGSAADGWPWVRLVLLFAVAFTVFGVLAYGSLMEEG